MKHICYFLVIFAFEYDFGLCKIPTLKVKQFNEDLVHKKRNDTLELCRMYNEFDRSLYLDYNRAPKRYKRQLDDDKEYVMKADEKANEKVDENDNAAILDDQEPDNENELANDRDIFNLHLLMPEQIGINKDFAPKLLVGPSEKKKEDDIDRIKWQKHWKHGIVPYFIDSKTYDTFLSVIIIKAFDYFEKTTCIRLQRLRERPIDKESMQNVEWLYITNPTGIRQCVHSNENKENSGVQVITFGYDCMSRGEIIHELMHVLGFSHEHVRADRDENVQIVWENIKPGYKKYFMRREDDVLSHFPYDYSSVMHYPPRAFSKNGHPTIETRTKTKIGQRNELSETDAEKVNYIYNAECLDRNRQYLKTTCPKVIDSSSSAININPNSVKNVSQDDISKYFGDRIWRFGVVSYKFKDEMEFTVEERENIAAVIKHIEQETCIRFHNGDDKTKTPRIPIDYYDGNSEMVNDKPNNTLNETDVTGKYSEDGVEKPFPQLLVETAEDFIAPNVNRSGRRHADNILVLERSENPGCECPEPGKPEGNEVLPIGIDCFNSANDLLHLFVHLLGLDHQHNAFDRDQYLQINWDKLSPEANEDLVKKLPPVASLGFLYDYQSVMHYPWLEIKGGVANIMYPIWNDGWAMGHWQGLSSTDVKKLNKLYEKECQSRMKYEKS